MVARGPGAVGCAHCKAIGGDTPCAVCRRLVCATCAADWATCDQPSGRIVRLGLTARLRDVDPAGHLGLVSRWRGPLRLFDLRRLRWIDAPAIPGDARSSLTHREARLTADGRLVYAAFTGIQDPRTYQGMAWRSLTGAVELMSLPQPAHGVEVSAVGDRLWYVTDTQHVVVVAPLEVELDPIVALPRPGAAPPVQTWMLEPLPYKVVQAAHVDGARDLLASGTWGEVALDRIVDGKLVRLGHAKTTGDLRWIAAAGPWLAAAVGAGRIDVLVWRLEPDLSIGPVTYRHLRLPGIDAASLSRDGRYLAIGIGNKVVVHALDDDRQTILEDHSDGLCLVRFAGDDHILVTADFDNRVVLRPRTEDGYAARAMPIDVPDAPVPL